MRSPGVHDTPSLAPLHQLHHSSNAIPAKDRLLVRQPLQESKHAGSSALPGGGGGLEWLHANELVLARSSQPAPTLRSHLNGGNWSHVPSITSQCPLLAHRLEGGTGSDGTSMEASHTESLAAAYFRRRGRINANCSGPLAAIKSPRRSRATFQSPLSSNHCSTSCSHGACV